MRLRRAYGRKVGGECGAAEEYGVRRIELHGRGMVGRIAAKVRHRRQRGPPGGQFGDKRILPSGESGLNGARGSGEIRRSRIPGDNDRVGGIEGNAITRIYARATEIGAEN